MSPDAVATSPARKRRRRRAAISCEPCRSRKVRCDKDLPCSACVRARSSMLCSYQDNVPAAATSKVPLGARSLPTEQSPETQSENSVAARLLTRGPSEAQPTYTEGSHHQQHWSAQTPLRTASPSGPSVAPPHPQLRHVPDKTKLFGHTHWVQIAEKFPISGKMHPVEIEPSFAYSKTDLFDLVKESRSTRLVVKAQSSVKLSEPIWDLSASLPAKGLCETLARCYIRTFEPMYRILHVPSFWKDFNRVWDQQPTDNASSTFLMKLVLVLAVGTTFHVPQDDEERDNLRRLAQTWIQAVQWLLAGPSEKVGNTIDGLQICCLLFLARHTTFNCDGPSVFVSAGSIIRTAMTMGLHRDPAIFAALTPFQHEFRKRLWATVLEITSQSCLTLGLPLGITDEDYDTPLPSNFSDVDLDPGAKTLPTPGADVTDSSLQIMLAKTLPCRLKIIAMLNNFRKHQPYDITLKLGAELRTACREIAGFFHQYSQSGRHNSDRHQLSPTDFHRTFLDIHIRRFSLYLHRPFMLQARVDPQFFLARKVCVEASTAILSNSKAMDLNLPFAEFDDLTRMSIVGRGVYKGALSFDAIMVLALEVITQLQDESAPSQTAFDAVDEMARAGRAPLVDLLRRLEPQLLLLIKHGGTSLKRYLFTATYLSQIRAMESGQPVKQALYENTTVALKKCCSLLRERMAAGDTPHEDLMAIDESFPPDMFPYDLGFADLTGFDWGNTGSLFFPGLNDPGNNGSQPVP